MGVKTDKPERTTLLRAMNIRKTFRMGDAAVTVLNGADITIEPGEFVAIEGRSGSGKSTLLHILGALDEPDDGVVLFEGQNIAALTGTERSKLRNTQVGFVFQFYHLLPELNVLENVMLAAMVERSWLKFMSTKRVLRERAKMVLSELKMDHRLTHRPNQLSGGERQRVAIARALMNQPRVLFADEPTGNLDYETGRTIMGVLESLHRKNGQTIVMVTHDRSIANTADRALILREGKLERADTMRIA